jgi:hypothetical protein
MPENDCEKGQTKVRLTAQDAAAELYQIAALMLGDDSQAAEVVEAAVARTEIDPCADAEASFEAARRHLVETAVSVLSRTDPRIFAAPAVPVSVGGCIEGDDLASAGVSADQLAGMVKDGAGRSTLRGWLNKLSAIQRIIFVQRAILGWGKAASGTWQARQVGEVFRQALCALATSLAHSATVEA